MSDWWLHFNERVRNRKEGEYGPFTNADWQAACQADAEIEKLKAEIAILRAAVQIAINDCADAHYSEGADGLRGEMRDYKADLMRRAAKAVQT